MMGCVSVNVRAVGSDVRVAVEKAWGCASVRCEATGMLTVVMGDVNHPMTVNVGMPAKQLNVGVGAVRRPVNVSIRLVCSTAGRFLDLSEYDVWVVNGVAYPVDVYSNVKWRVD